jgi:hypothetical protein
VTRFNLVEQAKNYLATWVFDDPAEAYTAADQFVDFCTGRAWVFTDTGTTADGEKLYQFTHRTFLEYFAASHITSTHATPESLSDVLLPRIRKQEWDVVALLAFQIQSKRLLGAADILLKRLLEPSDSLWERAACIAFAGRCLESMVPSPRVRRELVAAAVDIAIRFGVEGWESAADRVAHGRRVAPAVMVLSPLLAASNENRSIVADVVTDRLTNTILGRDDKVALAALEIALMPAQFTRGHRISNAAVANVWRDVFSSIVGTVNQRLKELAAVDFTTCAAAVLRGFVSIEDMVRWHGPESLFRKRTYRCVPNVAQTLSTLLTRRLVSYATGESREDPLAIDDVTRVGRTLLACDLPWVRSHAIVQETEEFYGFAYYSPELNESRDASAARNFSPDVLFGVFCLTAVSVELFADAFARNQNRIFKILRSSNLVLVARMVSTRFAPMSADKLLKLTARCGFDAVQTDFVRRWAAGDLALTESINGAQMQLLTAIDSTDAEISLGDLEDDSELVADLTDVLPADPSPECLEPIPND